MEWYGGYQVQSESGVDLTLLRENLRLPWEKRLANNTSMVNSIRGWRRPDVAVKEQPMPPFDPVPILKLLSEAKVEFVVIGGLAMNAHGSAYLTQDVDVCYARTRDNVERLAKVLTPLHPYLRGAPEGLPFRWDAPTILAGLNFTLRTDLGDLDLLGEVRGVGFYEALVAQSQFKPLHGLLVRVISLDDLIASKKAAGRVKDQLHILELVELKKMIESQPKP